MFSSPHPLHIWHIGLSVDASLSVSLLTYSPSPSVSLSFHGVPHSRSSLCESGYPQDASHTAYHVARFRREHSKSKSSTRPRKKLQCLSESTFGDQLSAASCSPESKKEHHSREVYQIWFIDKTTLETSCHNIP